MSETEFLNTPIRKGRELLTQYIAEETNKQIFLCSIHGIDPSKIESFQDHMSRPEEPPEPIKDDNIQETIDRTLEYLKHDKD